MRVCVVGAGIVGATAALASRGHAVTLIDRSPCSTGTSACMAQLAAKGRLAVGDEFVHESNIGSRFRGQVEGAATVGNRPAIIPSIGGWASQTSINTIIIDDRDPGAHGFMVV